MIHLNGAINLYTTPLCSKKWILHLGEAGICCCRSVVGVPETLQTGCKHTLI